ncbi:MAG: TonB-dependent receptor [Saprospiraceae bacterium]|nr:MAG: TonB-dependent receptor [Saprospiraceae bacterium]
MNCNLYTRSIRFCLLFAVFAHFGAFAHNGTIKGMVLDAQTNTGLAGAHVTLEQTGQYTYTDELGIFSFQDLPSGTFAIVVSYVGFQTARIEATVTDHETTPVKIAMVPARINLPQIEIKAIGDERLDNITSLDIHTRPLNTSQDILRIVPGLFIAQHAGGGKAEQIFLRGFDLDHGTDIRISVDGMPVNMVSHAHGQGYADLHWLIPEMVQRVDFSKGTYDSRAGNLATAGSVNFQTPVALRRSLLKLEAGQFDTWRAVAALDLLGEAGRSRSRNAWVASEYFFSNGYFDSPQNFTRFNLMGRYSTLIGEDQSVSMAFSTFRSRWDASGQIPLRAVKNGTISRFGSIDDTEGGETSRSNLSLTFSKNLGKRTFLKNQLYLVKYDFELYSNFTFFLDDPVNGDQIRQKEDRTIIGYNGSWNKRFTWGNLSFDTEFGVQLRYDDVQDNELSHTVNRRQTLQTLALGDVVEANAGLYFDQAVKISPRLSVHAGIRYDQFYFNYEDHLAPAFSRQTQAKGIVSPKLNLFYEVTPRLRLFAQGGIGFHSNDTRVVVARNGKDVLPKAHGIEMGMLWKPWPALLAGLSIWRLDLDQEFVYVGDEAVVEPGGRTQRQGIDLSLRWQLTPWLFADADFNYTLARAKGAPEGNDYIPLAPKSTSAGGLTAQTAQGWFASVRYRFMADRPANEDNSITAEGHFLVDALAGWKSKQFELTVSVQNLLDAAYNEAQFETESRLPNEPSPVTELHFTPGSPFFLKGTVTYFF